MFRSAYLPCLAVVTALAIAPSTGCGGSGGGGGSSSSRGALAVRALAVTPAPSTTNVPVSEIEIRVAVDRALDAASLAGSVFVEETGGAGARTIQGDVSYDAATREIVFTTAPGQALNALFPAEDILAFDRVYTIRLSQSIRSVDGYFMIGGFASSFRTAATRFALVEAGTSPRPGQTDVLVDPYRVEIGGQLYFATLQAKLDIPLAAATVSGASASGEPNVNVRVGDASGAIVPGDVGYDAATSTIFWTPKASANHNPAFPGEPLLRPATDYTLTITTRVTDAAGNAPTTPLTLSFETVAATFRAPRDLATGQSVLDLQVNEVFFAPMASTTDMGSDSNGDGVASAVSDEFVEIVNISSDYLDLRGTLVKDAVQQNPTPLDFTTLPAGQQHQALLAPGHAIVVWNGVESGRTVPNSKLLLGRSKAFFGALRGSASSLWNNTGLETIRVVQKNPAPGATGDCLRVDITNTATGTSTGSMTRSPDLSGAFVPHATLQGATGKFSPGRKVNGNLFP